MKKLLSILFALLLLCACQNTEPSAEPSEPSEDSENPPAQQTQTEEAAETEPSVWKIGEKEYEVDVPPKTEFDNSDGQITIATSGFDKDPITVDLSALEGCEDIKSLAIYVNDEAESIIVPKLPNAEGVYIYGTTAESIDVSAVEGTGTIQLYIYPDELIMGKGPEKLLVFEDFDISKLKGASNVKSITVNGDNNLSLIADIGEVEKVYILGEGKNLGELENLKSLKHLSLYSDFIDLSAIEKLTVETLVISGAATQNSFDSFTYSETVTELQIHDRNLRDVSAIENMPNLKEIFITVASVQDASIVFMEEPITEEMLSVLETNLEKEPLKAFMEKGGEIWLFADWTR